MPAPIITLRNSSNGQKFANSAGNSAQFAAGKLKLKLAQWNVLELDAGRRLQVLFYAMHVIAASALPARRADKKFSLFSRFGAFCAACSGRLEWGAPRPGHLQAGRETARLAPNTKQTSAKKRKEKGERIEELARAHYIMGFFGRRQFLGARRGRSPAAGH